MRASVRHCQVSLEDQKRKSHVCISSAASQQHEHHVDTFSAVLQAGTVPDQNMFSRIAAWVVPNQVFLTLPKVFDTFSALVPHRNMFSRVAVRSKVRTQPVVGNGGSSGSDMDLVADLRLARVGCLLQSRHDAHFLPVTFSSRNSASRVLACATQPWRC